MQPNHYDILSPVRYGTPDRTSIQMTRDTHQMARENTPLSRNQSAAWPMRSEDSWIEVSSQPSSSSLSSATNDDIVTTGLRVDRRGSSSAYHHNRRRHLRNLSAATAPHISYSPREPSSSQDEYEESESESDRVLSSSNEDITTRSRGDALLLRTRSAFNSSEAAPSSDDDDNSTALGMQINTAPFVPQPNAFSHPPASQTQSRVRVPDHSRSNSNLSSASRRTAIRNNSYPSARSSRRQQHSPYNMISPSYQADHDAALRASLSTLLSCAAAARGLPKNDTQPAAAGPSAQPSSFRLVSESVAMGEESGEEEPRRAPPATTSPSPAPNQKMPSTSNSANVVPPASKPKRRASSSKHRASSRPSTSKTRRSNLADSVVSSVSPTVMTWVISAGVVVLFSAISFSAGYALGREVGRTEAAGGMVGDGTFSSATTSAGCGKEAVKGGLKRLRWGAAAAGSSVSV
ncbi:hypothetical protein VTN00DRAFT_6891 [Thermoascus crustaceus]|uniref:uncharacterized protein n=1 Tax=Thermoascus crustaceus TaxID=5088 RepID=UPI003741F199